MRVSRVRKTIVSIPLARPIISAVRNTDHVINVLVEVETDGGPSGVSYVAGFTMNQAAAICNVLEDLGTVVLGLDATKIGLIWDRMWSACRLIGHAGLPTFALSAIDMALWDVQGKLLGAPLHRMLGTRRIALRAYASDGCWLRDDPTETAGEAAEFAANGFKLIKVRLGHTDPQSDVETMEAVRRAVGGSVRLIVDANQGWSRDRTYRFRHHLTDYDIEWLEEPLPADDIAGLRELRRALPVPIVAGENAYMLAGIRALIEAEAVSMVMPDLQRIGGITGWMRAGAVAEAWHLPITSHLFPEISLHVLASSAEVGPLEWVSWMDPVLREPVMPREGTVTVPDRPGLGIEFVAKAVQRYKV
jgi:L-alanine-DL-glutamate epimerase-like enolase superfamily enzyme